MLTDDSEGVAEQAQHAHVELLQEAIVRRVERIDLAQPDSKGTRVREKCHAVHIDLHSKKKKGRWRVPSATVCG